MPIQVIIGTQQYSLLLWRPRGTIPIYQVLAYSFGLVRRRGERRGVGRGGFKAPGSTCRGLHGFSRRMVGRLGRHVVGNRRERAGERVGHLATVEMGVQRFCRMACFALLALAQPVNLAQRTQHAGSVVDAVAVQVEDAAGAGAGRDGIWRGEGVVGRRRHHGWDPLRAVLELGLWRRTHACGCLVNTRPSAWLYNDGGCGQTRSTSGRVSVPATYGA